MNWKYYEQKFDFDKELPSSWWGHTFFVYDLIRNIKPKRVVELGTHYGVSFLAMCQATKDSSLDIELNAVDTWEGDLHAQKGYDKKNEVFDRLNKEIDDNYKNLNIKLHRTLFDDAVENFEDKSVDILHIDGFHTYEAVKHDFDSWVGKISDEGIILCHDIHERKKDFGVYKLWKELKKEYGSIEFYHWHGLGVLFMKENKLKDELINNRDELVGHYANLADSFNFNRMKERDVKINKITKDIDLIKSSKFWKMREKYLGIKNKIFGK